MAPETAHDVLSNEEVHGALDSLTKVENYRLMKKANVFAIGSGLEPDDLFQEAVRRSLEEEENGRNCPRSVAFPIFLGNVMKSIASEERRQWAREMPLGTIEDGLNPILQFADPAADPERKTVDRITLEETINKIEQLFADDDQALAIVIGNALGSSPEEICELETMTDKEYATARKRVRRAFLRVYPKGHDHE